ncbi:hypothetical protein R1sor_020622 [Riccia sorocarpa]|uniref:Thaumatin-like protein n=1 Tax=Riccia sorocarpa TaxID=122646 RepID=A0ABD3GID4_9MARC
MKNSRAFTTLLLWASLVAHTYGCGINVINRCSYTVTTCAQSNRWPGQVKGKIFQYELGAGKSQFLDFGNACKWSNGAVWPSVRQRCDRPNIPNEAYDSDVVNFSEFSIGSDGVDYYSVNNIAAYTLPMKIRPINPKLSPNGRLCGSPECVINDIPRFCKGKNNLIKFPTTAYSCQNIDGLAGNGPSDGTNIFKNACPDAFSYMIDADFPLYVCPTGINYEVIFCPDTKSDELISSL